jgi:dihydroorotase
MENSLIIKNAIHFSTGKKVSVLIEDGKIKQIADSLTASLQNEIDAEGLTLIPGVLDPQVHFRDPGNTHKEDLYTGSCAAAAGGVTSFFEMPNTEPATTTPELMAEKKKMASKKCIVNYNFFIGATPDNVDVLNTVENVPGIKIFMGSSTGNLLVNLEKDLDNIFGNGSRLIAVHAEDENMLNAAKEKFKDSENIHDHYVMRGPESALKATQLAVKLSKKYKRRLHILHMTTEEEADFLRIEKEDFISAELCPQHFLLKAPDIYDKIGNYAKMNPPIREARHGKALFQALKDGVIDLIATDHAPHTVEEKEVAFLKAPAGMPGVETSLPLLLDQANKGNCSLQDVVKWMCEMPCLKYKVKNKGFLKEGYDADLVLVDMKKEKAPENGKLFNKANWTPYNGMLIKGWPVITIVNGNIVFDKGKILDSVKGKEVIIEGD